jgi:hypothetical protein
MEIKISRDYPFKGTFLESVQGSKVFLKNILLNDNAWSVVTINTGTVLNGVDNIA